mmetsp:Transcript_12557/g.40147  ORF Transcript_12557/g.40147 Transcript_12557/m.40147 type:complete len:132 (-) Transcript_12557:88-483(-)
MAELDEDETIAAAPEQEEEVTDLMGAVKRVLKNALVVDGAVRGLHEVAKHIDAGKAQVVFLAESCNEPGYKKLVQGLRVEKNVPLTDVPLRARIDRDGPPREVAGASCVAVTEFGEEGLAYDFMMKHLGKA